ncbi:putative dehydrogenase [Anseongella ginsenosidimutans]|uniref:Putative dehydrogenase n=2 Tax=Anseongella ginsenosidimutans TaxID=496056 RepID=A0A4R3KMT8_9SPHI|nr:putative dehydrogenase [Anseongella ginsenosidimutans]
MLAGFAGASAILPMELLAGMRRTVAPADRINVGLIGCNGMGFADLSSMLKRSEANCIALCDVDQNVLSQRTADLAKAGVKKPALYGDYRKMLENKDIDAVIIGTPDHWHCLQLTDALEAGKDVYCEKPIANSVQEAGIMLAAVKKHGRPVQIGQWQRSQQHFADAVAFVRSGKLGNIRLVKAWAYQGWMKPVPVKPDQAPPAGVDYSMWLGPAPERAFNPNRFHFNFRWFWDYAGGLMTDWGVHLIDYVLHGMDATHPKSVMALGGKYAYPDDASETPDTLQTVYEFDNFTALWEHATGISGGNYGRNHGIAYIGNNGTLVLDRGGWEVIPEKDGDKPRMEAVPHQSPSDNGLDKNTSNFIDVMQSGDLSKLNTSIETGYYAALVSHLGNAAYKSGQRLTWDSNKLQFEEAEGNKYLEAQYHNNWKIPVY